MRHWALTFLLMGCGQSLVDFSTGTGGSSGGSTNGGGGGDLAMTLPDLSQGGSVDLAGADLAGLDLAGTPPADGATADGPPASGDLAGADLGGQLACPAVQFTTAGTQEAQAPRIAAQEVTATVTVEAWIYPTAIGSGDQVIVAHFGGTNEQQYLLKLDGTGKVVFTVVSVTLGAQSVTSAAPVVTGQWQHVAGSLEKGAVKSTLHVYRSGTGASTGNLTLGTLATTSTVGLDFGNYPAGNGPFVGYLSDARVSSIARYTTGTITPPASFTSDASTIALYHFNALSGTSADDSSSNANTATLNNGAVYADPPTCR